MDEDVDQMSREQLTAQVKKLRQGIRGHRDSTRHELCWHHPALWGLLPEKTDPIPVVPDWPQFLEGCLRYRQSLDEQLPDAPRTKKPYQAPAPDVRAAGISDIARPGLMHVKDLYSIVVTERRAECRDFYVRWFGFQVVFEASWFVYLAARGDHPFGLAFMAPDHPSQPPGRDAFNGKGLLLTLDVKDASAEFKRLKGAGLTITYPLHDEPWGQRRFAVYDPAGTWIDIIQQIDPAPGFWDQYLT